MNPVSTAGTNDEIGKVCPPRTTFCLTIPGSGCEYLTSTAPPTILLLYVSAEHTLHRLPKQPKKSVWRTGTYPKHTGKGPCDYVEVR